MTRGACRFLGLPSPPPGHTRSSPPASTCTVSRSATGSAASWRDASSMRPTTWMAFCSLIASILRSASSRRRRSARPSGSGSRCRRSRCRRIRCTGGPTDAMRLVFAGTPQAAVASLEALLRSRHEVAAVITRPDAPAGRGRRVTQSPVAARARSEGIEVLQPARLRDPAFLGRLRELAPDCCAVTAYGALIPQEALDIPPHGWVNLHFSLLPAWRGAAPVQHAILHGDEVTGASTFRIVRELDAGPVFGVVTEKIGPTDTAGDLLARLAVCGAALLVATLDGIEAGEVVARAQPPGPVSLAPKLTAEDARVRWDEPAVAVDRRIRACTPAPGAWTMLDGTRIKLGPLGPPDRAADRASGLALVSPGEMSVTRDGVFVGTATWPVRLGLVRPEGKRAMPAPDWARGLRLDGRPAVLA